MSGFLLFLVLVGVGAVLCKVAKAAAANPAATGQVGGALLNLFKK